MADGPHSSKSLIGWMLAAPYERLFKGLALPLLLLAAFE